MRLPETVRHMMAGGKCTAESLHFFDFKDGPKWIWSGIGKLKTYDGQEWEGVGDVISAEGGQLQSGIAASNLTLTLATRSDQLSDSLNQAALNSKTQLYGRRYFWAVQFFDENKQPLDKFFTRYVGVMDRMSFKQNVSVRQIILNVENPFVRMRSPRVQYFSDTDQRRRSAGDRGMEDVSSLANKVILWPKGYS